MSLFGDWKTVTIAIDGTLSAAVDLGRPWEHLQVVIPTIVTGTLNLHVSELIGGTYVQLGSTDLVASGVGGFNDTWTLGGWQFIKIKAGATQTATARVFRVRGYRN